jgi:hypothetical protein
MAGPWASAAANGGGVSMLERDATGSFGKSRGEFGGGNGLVASAAGCCGEGGPLSALILSGATGTFGKGAGVVGGRRLVA